MVMTRGLGALEVFMDTEEGAAFITDNGMFVTCVSDQSCTLLHIAEYKDPGCKFQLSLLPSGKILLRDFRGLYMSVFSPDYLSFMEPTCPQEYSHCEFEPYFEDDQVALKASNGMFLSRVFLSHYIAPSGLTPDESCRFRLVIGDKLLPAFDITSVELVSLANVKCKPCVVKSVVFVNESDEPEEHVFTLTWENRTEETTTWSRAWGMDFKMDINFPLLGIEGTISYNGTYQKKATFRHTIREVRTTTVTVLPKTRATANLVASMQENVEVPFKATISKLRADGGNWEISTELGKWKGLVYDTITIDVKQVLLKDDWSCRIV